MDLADVLTELAYAKGWTPPHAPGTPPAWERSSPGLRAYWSRMPSSTHSDW